MSDRKVSEILIQKSPGQLISKVSKMMTLVSILMANLVKFSIFPVMSF